MSVPRTLPGSKPKPGHQRHHRPETRHTSFYAHPGLSPDRDPRKGRLLRASAALPSGTVLLVDAPYATVPAVAPSGRPPLVCSNLACSRRVVQDKLAVRCPAGCARDVAWCDPACRAADVARHAFECAWLKETSERIRRDEGDYDLVTLWHVVRLLAGRALEEAGERVKPSARGAWKGGWEAVEECCSYLDSWPEDQVRHWKRLIERYLSGSPSLPCSLNPGELLSLVCKEETNTFGLYEKKTGPLCMFEHPEPRGQPYGASLYPRAAMFNHSCIPNVSHKPNSQGRMVYTAARDIAAGEECTITYFDLTALTDRAARQRWAQEQFRFTCDCERCQREEAQENLAGLDSLPLGDFGDA